MRRAAGGSESEGDMGQVGWLLRPAQLGGLTAVTAAEVPPEMQWAHDSRSGATVSSEPFCFFECPTHTDVLSSPTGATTEASRSAAACGLGLIDQDEGDQNHDWNEDQGAQVGTAAAASFAHDAHCRHRVTVNGFSGGGASVSSAGITIPGLFTAPATASRKASHRERCGQARCRLQSSLCSIPEDWEAERLLCVEQDRPQADQERGNGGGGGGNCRHHTESGAVSAHRVSHSTGGCGGGGGFGGGERVLQIRDLPGLEVPNSAPPQPGPGGACVPLHLVHLGRWGRSLSAPSMQPACAVAASVAGRKEPRAAGLGPAPAVASVTPAQPMPASMGLDVSGTELWTPAVDGKSHPPAAVPLPSASPPRLLQLRHGRDTAAASAAAAGEPPNRPRLEPPSPPVWPESRATPDARAATTATAAPAPVAPPAAAALAGWPPEHLAVHGRRLPPPPVLVERLRRGSMPRRDLLSASEALTLAAQLGAFLNRGPGSGGRPAGVGQTREQAEAEVQAEAEAEVLRLAVPLLQRALAAARSVTHEALREAAVEVVWRYAEPRRGAVDEAIARLLQEACAER